LNFQPVLAVITILILGTGSLGFSYTVDAQIAPDRYIIVFKDDVQSPSSAASDIAKERGLGISHVYEKAIKGFSAIVPRGQLDKVLSDPRVDFVEQDLIVSIFAKGGIPGPPLKNNDDSNQPPQTTPTGISRIGGVKQLSSSVNVAVLDTGIANHPDLNVVEGINFANGPSNKYQDKNGHGTHVAGTIGALDNSIGVVGVAPGANLYAIKVLNNNGMGFTSDIIAGLDWLTERNTNGDSTDDIDVANMSIGGLATITNKISTCNDPNTNDAYHDAICSAVAAGVTIVVAAGNSSDDANNYRPATWDEVITVSALADFDGLPGGFAPATCRNDDDTLANFSNFGADVDMIAPGVCIRSTWTGDGYYTISGTSMASPHVAGAAALYLASNSATPDQVKAALISLGSSNWNDVDDPDEIQEPLLDVSTL